MSEHNDIFSMIVQNLKDDLYLSKYSNKIKLGRFSINSTRFDNWNGGTTYYEALIELPSKIFKQIDYDDLQKIIVFVKEHSSKLFDDEYNFVESADIRPIIETIVDWDSIVGITTPEKINEMVEIEKKFLISIATGVDSIKSCNVGYKENHTDLKKYLKMLMISMVADFGDLWDWYSYYKSNKLDTYQSRRDYINKSYKPISDLLNSYNEDEVLLGSYKKTGIEIVDESVLKMQQELEEANDRIDYNQIGVRCRETIILLAKEIYDDDLHHPKDFPDKISPDDSKRMIDGYISYKLPGSNNENKRKLLRSTSDLANDLTHSKTATRFDALLALQATISLISLIKIINKEIK